MRNRSLKVSHLNPEQLHAVQTTTLAILESIIEAGDLGAPEGVIYSALMAYGCTLSTFQQLVAPLKSRGYVSEEEPHLLVATEQGRSFALKLKSVLDARKQTSQRHASGV